jgi:hypothetical protein
MKKESRACTGRRVNVKSEKNCYCYQAPENCFLVHSESIKAASSQKVPTYRRCGSGSIFFIPDPGSRLKKIPDTDPQQRI